MTVSPRGSLFSLAVCPSQMTREFAIGVWMCPRQHLRMHMRMCRMGQRMLASASRHHLPRVEQGGHLNLRGPRRPLERNIQPTSREVCLSSLPAPAGGLRCYPSRYLLIPPIRQRGTEQTKLGRPYLRKTPPSRVSSERMSVGSRGFPGPRCRRPPRPRRPRGHRRRRRRHVVWGSHGCGPPER